MFRQPAQPLSRPARYILLLDVVLLVLSMAYITLYVEDVPFHGDEATTIWTTRHFQTAILEGDPAALQYQAAPRHTPDQHLRIVTGPLPKIIIGASWHAAGFEVSGLNNYWIWHASLTENQQQGNVPDDRLLYVSRLASAWMAALGGVFVLAAARVIARQTFIYPTAVAVTGWGALGLYTAQPAILLNGRRAMSEGVLLLGLALLGWMVLQVVIRRRWGWWHVLGLGLVTGLALSTKHSAIFTVVLLFAGLGLLAVWHGWRTHRLAWLGQRIGQLSLVTGLALLIFLTLNPLWWSAPLEMPEIVYQERQSLLERQQVMVGGGYTDLADRLDAVWREMVPVEGQYYEWPDWITYQGTAAEIIAYEASPYDGLQNSTLTYLLRYGTLAAGLALILYVGVYGMGATRRVHLMLAWWLAGLALISLVTIPMHWQRYYLPLQIPLLIVQGLGLGLVVEMIVRRVVYQPGELTVEP